MNKTTRVFSGGRADLEGRKVNTLTVGDVASYSPFRWHTTCSQCHISGQTASHQEITMGSARCKNPECVRGLNRLREELAETPRQARERERAIARDRQRKIEEAEAAKVAAIEAEYQTSHRELGKLVRERILSGNDEEVGSIVSEDTRNLSMTQADAEKYNAEQAALFVQSCPEYAQYRNRKTFETIAKYVKDHKIAIVSAETVRGIFYRLRDYGLLQENPAPIPERVEAPAPYVNLSVEQEQQKPDGETGIDPLTGKERFYSDYEINRMSAAEYRARFRIVPTIAELFSIPK